MCYNFTAICYVMFTPQACGKQTNLGFGWMVGIGVEANMRSRGPSWGNFNNKWYSHVPKYRKSLVVLLQTRGRGPYSRVHAFRPKKGGPTSG